MMLDLRQITEVCEKKEKEREFKLHRENDGTEAVLVCNLPMS
jgi:hypothetical protein